MPKMQVNKCQLMYRSIMYIHNIKVLTPKVDLILWFLTINAMVFTPNPAFASSDFCFLFSGF